MKRITVFCGLSHGAHPSYTDVAIELGQFLADQNITLIYGGAQVGLMGAIANAVLSKGGKAIGVIPRFLHTKEIAHDELSELILVDGMHERKKKMNDLCDGFITLPGGFGTLEELFEVLTWAQLGLHRKPIGLLNINQYYTPLIEMIDQMVRNQFLKEINQKTLLVEENISPLYKLMTQYQAPEAPEWLNNNQSRIR